MAGKTWRDFFSATRSRGVARPALFRAVEALDVVHLFEVSSDFGPEAGPLHQFGNGLLTAEDARQIDQRIAQPLLELAASHGGAGLVHNRQERAFAPLKAGGLKISRLRTVASSRTM